MVARAALRLAPQSKVVLHRQFSDYLVGKRIYPIGLEISPSGICNATCNFCWYAGKDGPGQHRNVFLNTNRATTLLVEMSNLDIRAATWTGGGDPSLHPDIDQLVKRANAMGMSQGMFTNALAEPKYNPALLDWIRVTMTDRPYRADYIGMLRPTKNLSIAFNYAGPEDDEYLWRTLHLAEDVGVDYVQLRPALAFHGKTVDITPPDIKHPLLHVTDYKFAEAAKKHGYAQCEGFHFVPFLWETGDLDVCAYMQQHEGYRLGNIYEKSLKQILDDAPDFVPVHEQCQVCCKLHETNLAIHEARTLQDVNFP